MKVFVEDFWIYKNVQYFGKSGASPTKLLFCQSRAKRSKKIASPIGDKNSQKIAYWYKTYIPWSWKKHTKKVLVDWKHLHYPSVWLLCGLLQFFLWIKDCVIFHKHKTTPYIKKAPWWDTFKGIKVSYAETIWSKSNLVRGPQKTLFILSQVKKTHKLKLYIIHSIYCRNAHLYPPPLPPSPQNPQNGDPPFPHPCTKDPSPCTGINKLANVRVCCLPWGVPEAWLIFWVLTSWLRTTMQTHKNHEYWYFSTNANKSSSPEIILGGKLFPPDK